MSRICTKWPALVVLLLLAAMPTWAKRKPAPEVTPVVYQGVRYAAPNLVGDKGYVQAWDIKTGKQLWQTVVYQVPIDPRKETDVQWRFITGLKIQGDELLVTNESDQRFALDRGTGRVKNPAVGTQTESAPASFPGTIALLPGYTSTSVPGVDSQVGSIRRAGGLTIQYDIGKMAGDAAKYQRDTRKALWFKEQTVQGKRVEILLASPRSLVVSFPESSANFYATPNTDSELVDVLLMVLTYVPPEPKAR